MTTLLLAEHDNKTLKDATNKALTAAKALGGDVHVLVAGKGCRGVAEAAAKLDGVDKVLLADGAAYEHMLAEPLAALIVSLAPVLRRDRRAGDHHRQERHAARRRAARRHADLRHHQGGRARHVRAADLCRQRDPDRCARRTRKVITVRTATFQATGEGGSAPIEDAAAAADPGVSAFVGEELSKSERPELTSAKIIISGGRAMQSRENFTKYIEPVADKLGAAVGASRAAVDAGYAPNDWQVGQTGKVVAPELYIAVGISGAIQHLAGMKDSKVIVAINKDEEAPIFQVADYGLVADLYQALPELAAELGKLGR